MLTAVQCQTLASEYRSLARRPDVSQDRAAMLRNVAGSLRRLATQLDMLEAHMRDERSVKHVDTDKDGHRTIR
jgi:hypothetical protein